MKKECFHQNGWRPTGGCDLCRFRAALERIQYLCIRGDIDPSSKAGRALNNACEIAFNALNPEFEKNLPASSNGKTPPS